jgi:predicted alpha/beta-fold hydrolase
MVLPAEIFADLPPFKPRFPWLGADLQTVRNTVLRRGADLAVYPLETLRLPLADGSGDTLLGLYNVPLHASLKPLVVVLHGLGGGAESFYVRNSAAAFLAAGFPTLRLFLRGAGPTRPLCRQHYHAGRSGDIEAALAALPDVLRAHGVLLMGFSLGGNMLLKFLGERGADAGDVIGGVAVSAPIDLAACCRAIMRRRNELYHRYILNRMKRDTLPTPDLPARFRDAALSSRTVYEFDDRFVGPINGWSGAEEYYAVNSAARYLGGIRQPTLVIHAEDDPWIPIDCYRAFDWGGAPHLRLMLAKGGGHVGFHDRKLGLWHDACARAFAEHLSAARRR